MLRKRRRVTEEERELARRAARVVVELRIEGLGPAGFYASTYAELAPDRRRLEQAEAAEARTGAGAGALRPYARQRADSHSEVAAHVKPVYKAWKKHS